ncbi:MAG: class I SAM-dependent methyltransferase [Hyphomicrobiales bacterium]
MADQQTSIQSDQSAYRAHFDGGVSTLMSQMWGGNLHMGYFEAPDEPLANAQIRTKHSIANLLELQPDRRLIEVACGVGTTAIHLAKMTGASVDATNISETQLAEARERAAVQGLSSRVSFAFGDYHQLDASPQSYDAWLCQEALLYAHDRQQVFAEARRVVKPGGRIVFTDLTLSNSLSQTERESLMTDIKAPHFWSIEQYDAFVGRLGMPLVARHEWGLHAARTFKSVAQNIQTKRDQLVTMVGEEAVRQAEFRIDRQYRLASAGHLGWCLFCLKVPLP